MHIQRQIDYLQAQRASEWLEVLKQGRAQDMAAFREWCRKSPLHIQEFLEITCTERAMDEMDFEQADKADDLISLLRETAAATQSLPRQLGQETIASRVSDAGPRTAWRWQLAAVVALSMGVALYLEPWSRHQEFSTKVGEQRTVELRDASVVTLNTDSDIKVQFEEDVRKIELRHGEAVFKVAHDPSRPFQVHTRAGIVQAIGTKFNVYDRPEGIDVTVLEGRVRLTSYKSNGSEGPAAQEFVAGEEARIALNGSISRVARADLERVTAWSKRRLKFHNEPLEQIVREFNRYHRDRQLRLEGIPEGSRHYSGIFDADDPGTLARFLERESDLSVERSKHDIVIRAKENGRSP